MFGHEENGKTPDNDCRDDCNDDSRELFSSGYFVSGTCPKADPRSSHGARLIAGKTSSPRRHRRSGDSEREEAKYYSKRCFGWDDNFNRITYGRSGFAKQLVLRIRSAAVRVGARHAAGLPRLLR